MRATGIADRWRARHMHKRYAKHRSAMDIYENTLKQIVDVGGDGHSYHQDTRQINFKLKEGEVYGLTCPDNSNYYRTVLIKKMGVEGVLKPLISNPVYGDIPENIRQVSPEQVYQFMRLHNMQTLNAFPFKGNEQ